MGLTLFSTLSIPAVPLLRSLRRCFRTYTAGLFDVCLCRFFCSLSPLRQLSGRLFYPKLFVWDGLFSARATLVHLVHVGSDPSSLLRSRIHQVWRTSEGGPCSALSVLASGAPPSPLRHRAWHSLRLPFSWPSARRVAGGRCLGPPASRACAHTAPPVLPRCFLPTPLGRHCVGVGFVRRSAGLRPVGMGGP